MPQRVVVTQSYVDEVGGWGRGGGEVFSVVA